ncbi:NUDIX hydrolase [Marinilongibacter aquaticus]|uniref:NUDIX domain-containing protein n=1 Tax=Marinilongibacter aquaticus TaxID=2975157 RepID=UPI0021BDE35A|nr:NUDIX hydrolase [Marinilongibacter aquaticus]UBM57482.1 NUDIX hydrolase [Marinilongibacter aquaticus]
MKTRTAALIVEKEHILCLKYKYADAWVYTLPGGNLEFGEEMKNCLVRELEEELLLKARVMDEQPIFSGEVYKDGQCTLHVVYAVEIVSGEPTINPAETSANTVLWVPIDELAALNLYPNVKEAIVQWKSGALPNRFLGEINQPWF